MNDANMIIVSKDRKSAANMEHVSATFIGHDGHSLKATYAGGGGCQLGEYETDREAQEALLMLVEAIRIGAGVFYMPDDETVRIRISGKAARKESRPNNGRKQKGHGGS